MCFAYVIDRHIACFCEMSRRNIILNHVKVLKVTHKMQTCENELKLNTIF